MHVDFTGRVEENIFNTLGQLAQQKFFDNLASYDNGEGTPTETWTSTYDARGRLIELARSGVAGSTTVEYTYNADGLVTKIDGPAGIIRYEYEAITNRLTRTFTTDAAGEVLEDIRYTYDGFGRQKTVTAVKRNDVTLATPETTTYAYDLAGNLARTDLPNGVISAYQYDVFNRLDKLTQYAPDGTPQNLADNQKLAEYDYTVRADGRRTGVTETTWFDDNADQVPDAHTSITEWDYDELGRLHR